MITCRECGAPIEELAERCPYCGAINELGAEHKYKTAAAPAKTAEVVIYTNADEEAQTAMKNALDKNGMKGAYLIQSFGTSELGGKLAAEGKNIEADVVTLSTYYLDSFQKKEKLFADLQNKAKTIQPSPSYWTPILCPPAGSRPWRGTAR